MGFGFCQTFKAFDRVFNNVACITRDKSTDRRTDNDEPFERENLENNVEMTT